MVSAGIETFSLALDASEAESERLRFEKDQQRRWRYEMQHPQRKHGSRHPSGPSGSARKTVRYFEYPFLAFDGEATQDASYCLIGASDGTEVSSEALTTEQCLDFFLEKKREYPQSICIIFGGRYDFDEICRKSMPWRRISQLKNFGQTYWHGYKLRQAEGKWFEIARDGVTVRVFEIHGWFHCSYEKALAKYKTPVSGRDALLIREGKKARGTFLWKNIADVSRYMHAELRYMPLLMDCIRDICLDAGFRPRAWYGPSALATELLTRNKTQQYMGKIPEAVNLCAQFAYAGGRFEMPRGGIINRPVYSADWNSAYMTAALELPCLKHGEWRYGRDFEAGKFGVYHIRYRATDSAGNPGRIDHRRIYPLFRRYANGNVLFSNAVEGWYWSPEAELVREDKDATFLGAWIFDAKCTHQPFAFVGETYRKRQLLEASGSPAGQAFKWALAAIYGQLVRAVGWDRFKRTAPKYHCLEWGGYITSRCRAEMFRIAEQCGDQLLSIDTDSVTAMCPIPLAADAVGKQLGQWKLSEADGGIFFQNGIYCTHVNGDYQFKQRGIAEDTRIERSITPILTPELLRTAIETGKPVELRPKQRYVTLKMALNHRTADAGKWEEHPSDKLVFGGGGKRTHNQKRCHLTCSDGIHLFMHNVPIPTRQTIMMTDISSVRYPLPWKDEKQLQDYKLIHDIMWIDPENIDKEEAWLIRLIEQGQVPRAPDAAIPAGAR